jgi:TDG/mug DNA glycosylase family protein
VGHHFAGHSNRFWGLLHESGLTDRRFAPEEDSQLPRLGLGITNLVDRPTREAKDLSPAEFDAGRLSLHDLIAAFRPQIVAYVGKDVYRHFAAVKHPVSWGLQAESVIPGVVDFVVPNPSGLNRIPKAELLRHYTELAALRGARRAHAGHAST